MTTPEDALDAVYARASQLKRRRLITTSTAAVVVIALVAAGAMASVKHRAQDPQVLASMDARPPGTQPGSPSSALPDDQVPSSDPSTTTPAPPLQPDALALPAGVPGPIPAERRASLTTTTPQALNRAPTNEANPTIPPPATPTTNPATTPAPTTAPTTSSTLPGLPDCQPSDFSVSITWLQLVSVRPAGTTWYASVEIWSRLDHDCYFRTSSPWVTSVRNAGGTEVYHFQVAGDPPRRVAAGTALFTNGSATWDPTCARVVPEMSICTPSGPGTYTLSQQAFGFRQDLPLTITP